MLDFNSSLELKLGTTSAFAVLCFVSQMAVALSQEKSAPNAAPELKQEEVIALAQAAAKDVVGEKLDQYVLKETEFIAKYKEWRVFFDEKGPALSFDGCFTIFVDDETRKTMFRACP